VRVRAKTVTKTISKTLPPIHTLDVIAPREAAPVTPPPQDAVTGAILPDDEQGRMEVFRQVEEAVADEGLTAFRELPLEEDLEGNLEENLEENLVEEIEPVVILVQEEEAAQEAGVVILGTPPVVPFLQFEEEQAEQEEKIPVFAEETPVFALEPPPEEPATSEPAPEPAPEEPPPTPEPAPKQPTPCPGRPYMVRRGDSLQLIARRFDVSVRALMEANPEMQPGRLVTGDVLCIPLPEPPATPPASAPVPPASEGTHRVQEGESIADILLMRDVSLSAFQALNPKLHPGQQRVGDMVRVPQRGARGRCREGMPHSVADGEDIAAFAARHEVTAGMLLRANPHLLPSDFRPGQVACVPRKE